MASNVEGELSTRVFILRGECGIPAEWTKQAPDDAEGVKHVGHRVERNRIEWNQVPSMFGHVH